MPLALTLGHFLQEIAFPHAHSGDSFLQRNLNLRLGTHDSIRLSRRVTRKDGNLSFQFVYILELNDGHWYVGTTTDVQRHLKEHQSGLLMSTSGLPQWSTMHLPANLYDSFPVDERDLHDVENAITLSAMATFGWRKVRGGDFCQKPDEVIKDNLTGLGVFDFVTNGDER